MPCKIMITHYQRIGAFLTGWCGIKLTTYWTLDKEKVTCKRCIQAIKKYKTEDNLPRKVYG